MDKLNILNVFREMENLLLGELDDAKQMLNENYNADLDGWCTGMENALDEIGKAIERAKRV